MKRTTFKVPKVPWTNSFVRGGVIAIVVFLMLGIGWELVERNRAGMGSTSEGEVIKAPKPKAPMLKSVWQWEQYRDGQLIDAWTEHNLVTNEGLTALLGVMFRQWPQVDTWYVFIIESNEDPSGATTYASPGMTECTAYDETSRRAYVINSGVTTVLSNSESKASFTINATKTIYGAGLVSGVTKADTTSGLTLYNYSKFSSSKSVADDDVLKVTITITAQDT